MFCRGEVCRQAHVWETHGVVPPHQRMRARVSSLLPLSFHSLTSSWALLFREPFSFILSFFFMAFLPQPRSVLSFRSFRNPSFLLHLLYLLPHSSSLLLQEEELALCPFSCLSHPLLLLVLLIFAPTSLQISLFPSGYKQFFDCPVFMPPRAQRATTL